MLASFKVAWNDLGTVHTWAQICILTRTLPAPLDEKSISSFCVFGTL